MKGFFFVHFALMQNEPKDQEKTMLSARSLRIIPLSRYGCYRNRSQAKDDCSLLHSQIHANPRPQFFRATALVSV